MPRHMRKLHRTWSLVLVMVTLFGLLGLSATHASAWINATTRIRKQVTLPTKKIAQSKTTNQVKLNVPLIDQNAKPRLYNGCEVTSLAMLLNYYGINVTKNQLADQLPSEPLTDSNGNAGDPNDGFVGDITGDSAGLGVYHGPIYKLAKSKTKRAQDLSGAKFSQIIDQVQLGHPVWTITTTTFAPVSSMQTWQTAHGPVNVTYDMHSVVIVGFNRAKQLIYINNPYGTKQQAVNWKNFENAYNQMGKQAVDLR